MKQLQIKVSNPGDCPFRACDDEGNIDCCVQEVNYECTATSEFPAHCPLIMNITVLVEIKK